MDAYLEVFFEKCYNVSKSGIFYVNEDNKEKGIVTLLKTDKNARIMFLGHFYHLKKECYKETILELLKYDTSLSRNADFAYEILKYDIELLEYFPRIQNHTKIQLVQLAKNPEKIQQYKKWQTLKKSILAVKFNPIVYRYLNESWKNNEEIIRIALTHTIFYPELIQDKKYGIFFDLSKSHQKDKKIIKIALNYNPSLFKALDSQSRKDSELITIALRKGFHENNVSSFYELQNIIPYIHPMFYTEIKNIIYLMRGFENNILEAKLYTDCTILIFSKFLKLSSKSNKMVNDFFESSNIKNRFEVLVKKHIKKLYNDDINPTGIEWDINNFFSETFDLLSIKFERYMLLNKIENELSNKKIPSFNLIEKKTKL